MTKTVHGVCHHDCPDSCGWTVTVEGSVDGYVATKLRGDPDHPFSQGELCPKVNRFLERVYSPDRILTPLRRTGVKGSGEFAPISWEAALAEIALRWQEVVTRYGGETIAPFSSAGNQSWLALNAHQRFMARIGASRQVDSVCGATAGAGFATTYGSARGADPVELRHAKCVVLWGTNTRLTNRHLWPFVEEARAKGAMIICIDPLKTMTADSSDWHIQLRPGTDVALMLGLVHAFIRNGHVDHDYVGRYSEGFDDLAAVASMWDAARTAEVCGLSIEDVERLASTLGATPPVHFRTLIGAEHREQGATFFRMLACLPVVLGSWRHRGGGASRSVGTYTESVLSPIAPVKWPEGNRPRGLSMNQIGRWLNDGRLDPPVMALMVWSANPVITIPNAEATRRGLAREDLFTVVHEQFITDTARYADIILPATTQIEAVDVVPSWGSMHLNWNHAAIAPLGESVSNTELFRRLSQAMGFTEPEHLLTDDELLANAFANTDSLGSVTLESLREVGTLRINLPEDFRPYAEGGFATGSGKAELASSFMESFGHGFVPDYCEPEADAAYPLSLMTPKIHTRFLNSSYAHLPNHGGREGEPFVELSEADALARLVDDGDLVEVFNERASLKLRARIGTTVRSGLVIVPFGWNTAAHADGKSANALTNDTIVNWGGGVAFSDTRVEVRRIAIAVTA